MLKKSLKKIGYYEIFEVNSDKNVSFLIDSGKVIYSKKLKKFIINPYRDVKNFDTLIEAETYIKSKLNKRKKTKIKAKSLYLVTIIENKTNNFFIKVGVTSKKHIISRFSKDFGYNDYKVESILRRINTDDAEELEEMIKKKLNNKKSINKYRPLLESFSGYSECYNYSNLNEILVIFDGVTKKYV